MAFPTNLKDEIKADGITAKQYKQIDVISGASLNGGNPIVLQRYDKPKQQGSVLNAKMVNAIHQRLNELDGAVVTDVKHVTRIGADLVFENGITIKAGAENILYYMVGDTGHLILHGGNIGGATAGNSIRLDGYRVIKDIITVNPAGLDYAVIPCHGKDVHFASVLNGNWDACNARPTSLARQFSNMIIFFDRAFTGNVQLNVLMFYPE